MQGGHYNPYHHQQIQQQQHLASLLTAAAATSSPSPAAPSPLSKNSNVLHSKGDDTHRISALDSLRRSLLTLYPASSQVISHSAPFLSHGLFQLLSDRVFSVRRAAAITYACLSALSASIPSGSTGIVDRFISWALPQLKSIGDLNCSSEIALDSLHEFLTTGDAVNVERYLPSILKACQELLEDERTSFNLLHQLLHLLTLISCKFEHCFGPHFVDIVDVLLGWALMPELSASNRCVITDSFLKFQNQWLINLQFSTSLLSKFMDDMEILIQDLSLEFNQQAGRLFALFSCFSTVLQVTISGSKEVNLVKEIRESVENITPRFSMFVLSFLKVFGWSNWMEESWKCLILLAEILQDKFSKFYPITIDILFQCMNPASSQILELVKTNMRLLSLQKSEVLPSAVKTLLQFESPLSQLRLHPNHLVVASSANTYIFLVQHGCDRTITQIIRSLIEELEIIKSMLVNCDPDMTSHKKYTESELLSLIKFDLKLIICSVSIDSDKCFSNYPGRIERLEILSSFMLEMFNPFEQPIHKNPGLQINIVRSLQKISESEFLIKLITTAHSCTSNTACSEFLIKYGSCLIIALDSSSALGVKLEALNWISTFGKIILHANKHENLIKSHHGPNKCVTICNNLLIRILNASYDREISLRSSAASVLEVLLNAQLLDVRDIPYVSLVVLDRLSDPDTQVKCLYIKLLSVVLPLTIYTCGFFDERDDFFKLRDRTVEGNIYNKDWKQLLATKHFPRRLQSQQLVSILSFVSQKLKAPLSSWVQRLVFSCRGKREHTPILYEAVEHNNANSLQSGDILDKMFPVSNLAAIWWSLHEASRYCINLRLRTNLGGPTQTFAAIERMLLDIPTILLQDVGQCEGKHIGSYNFHLLPMRLLLEFVESLKKNVYNAYEGSCILHPASKQSSLFFKANKKVCEEWFSRICEPMMHATLSLHCHDATFHYCVLKLQDLRDITASTLTEKTNNNNLRSKLALDVLKVLRHASLSLCKRHEPESLAGLQKWSVTTFHSLFGENDINSWMAGLVYQAQGQFEKAAAYFSHLLQSEEVLTSLGSDGIQFVIARAIECYSSVSDWKSLENWLSELQLLRTIHAGKSYSGALTSSGNELNVVHALACFDEGNFDASWSYLDLTPKNSNELTLDPKSALERSEYMLLRSMLEKDKCSEEKVLEDLNKARSMLDETLSTLPLDGVNEAAACVVQLHCIYAFEEGMRLNDTNESVSTVLGSLHQVLNSSITTIYRDCSLWLKILRTYHNVIPKSHITHLLSEKVLRLARKQKNFSLANRLLNFNHNEILSPSLQFESILLKYAEEKHEEAMLELWLMVGPAIMSSDTSAIDISNDLKAKACLKLNTWLKNENSSTTLRKVVSKIHDDFNVQNEYHINSISGSNLNRIIEDIIGITTKVSCSICPTMGKAWLSYSSWCFNQAKNSLLIGGSILNSDLPRDKLQMTEEEITKVRVIFAKIFYDEENETLVDSLVNKTIYLMHSAANAPGLEISNNKCPSTTLASQLHALFLNVNISDDRASYVDELINIWWSLRKRRVELFGHAAQGYFKYLSISSSIINEEHCAISHCNFAKSKASSSTLRAMLYILHILLNYGVELKDTLKIGFTTVPLLPWQEITPQLFSRLSSHPVEIVRKQLEEILIMMAKQSPSSIVYPMLVDINANDSEPSAELQKIYDYLAKLYPNLIHDVQLVINGLEAITVLWEEQWLHTLQDLHTDVRKRIHMLKEEATRIAENSTLNFTDKNKINAAKYSAIMTPVVVALERRLASTSCEPKTPHESWFQRKYNEQLKFAISAFKSPPTSIASLNDVWRPFDAITSSLVKCQDKASVNLNEVAPQLALLSTSEVPMPGLEKKNLTLNSSITISSFCEQVTILSTKTKPKKIVFVGSDGQKYTYLLKGREDLRLDARIMQLLQTINDLFNSCTGTTSRLLAIRYYSVTPVSGRAGLIQWVDNASSMYSIYKSWQIRRQITQLAANGAGNTNNELPRVPRPSDMFYGKIIPALKEKGIRKVISRRDWPHEVKRKVLIDLMMDTPKEIIWQEMWCASEGFKNFRLKTKRFSSSVAAMSMVGHILGLGDRHLDNILMDFSSGDVIHIDYNVCFDKGRKLKIPEIVPFRLTQTIETALGLTGVEGTFRANCESVINILRKNKDILLMLLEVFVWDPLVEWTRGDNHDEAVIGGEEKRGMELAVSLSLFASRFQEIRTPLQEHHDLVLSALPAVETAIKKFSDAMNQYEVVSTSFHHADKEKATLMQLETAAKTNLTEARSISKKSQEAFELQANEFAQSKVMATEKAQEASIWIDQHKRILDALRNGSLLEAKSFMRLSDADSNVLSLMSAVTISKVPLTVVPEPTQAQCNDMDREVCHVIIELYDGISLAFEAINEYAFALKSVLPLNYFTTSPINSWAQVLQLSINNLSSDALSIARVQASDIISKSQGDKDLDSVQQKHHDLLLRIDLCAKHIHKIENECTEMTMSIGANTETKAKENMLSAFTKYMHSVGYLSKKDKKHDNDSLKKTRISLALRMAANVLTKDIKDKVLKFSNTVDANNSLFEFEELIERYMLVTSSMNELHKLIGVDNETRVYETNWVLVFQSCKKLLEQMTDKILPEMIKSILSHSSEAMDAFGIISQIHGSVDTAMEQLAEIEVERKSLVELEKTYFTKVGSITEQQEVLKEASMKEKDNLSWEEAEEIATQEEDCRAQLDQLNQTWDQRDARVLSLAKVESTICNSLVSSEQYFSSLLKVENEGGFDIISGLNLLSSLAKPFSDLELCDNMLKVDNSNEPSHSITDTFISDSRLLDSHSFFIWKVGILYSILNTCVHEISSVDHNIDIDYNALSKKLEVHLHKFIGRYLKKRIAPAFISQLEMENKNLDLDSDKVRVDASSVRRVQLMFEEYCNADETSRVARSTISTMKKQISEFHGALYRAILEIAQMEWLHDSSLPHLLRSNMLPQNIIEYDQRYPLVCSLNRAQLLEKIQSSISTIRKSLDYLQTCEKTSMQVEGQLERAMGWACGGTNNFEIPSEFHGHLKKRKQFLQKVREQASNVINICTSVMEFEASRDGLYWMPGEKSSGRPVNDGRSWQQAYLTSLTNLDDAYHSLTRAERELKLAQSTTEAAVSALCSATDELYIASVKTKSASDGLQGILSALRDSAHEASLALSNFGSLSKSHLALISECGSMLEEVLAISKGLDDIYSLGKEAASVHSALVDEFSKVNNILLPLESSLSADVSALSVALSKDRESSNTDIPPIHGQALHKSYNIRVREASHALTSLVPAVIKCVEKLHTMLTKLARSSSMHAGNLHKALEGLGESQEVRSQNLPLSETDISSGLALYGNQEDSFHLSNEVKIKDLDIDDNSYSINDEEWISPPEFTLISSSNSSIISDDETLQGKLQDFKYLKENNTCDSIVNNDGHENVLVVASKSESDHSGSMQDLLLPHEIQIASRGISGSEVIENSQGKEENKKEPDPKNDSSSLKMIMGQGHKFEDNLSTLDPVSRITKGQNPYALSVLRQVELKLDGRDIEHNGSMNIPEQVDYLLKQAMSIDNLCNMYEGWTPWI